MITSELLIAQDDIKAVVSECLQFAKNEQASLPFQYMHMPLAWWETFQPDQDGELFWQKRGKNFLGVQSRLEKFYLLIARTGKELSGVAPLVQYALKVPASQDEVHIVTLAGDYVLHPFQDFVVTRNNRQEIVSSMLAELTTLLDQEASVFWAGCIPQDSPNLEAYRQACVSLLVKEVKSLEAVTYQRGGVWPWTLHGIAASLKRISDQCVKSEKNIKGLTELAKKISECTPQALLFPGTRSNLLQEIEGILPSVQQSKNVSTLAEKLESFLYNTPMLYPYIELPSDREEYLATLSYSTRRYFRRYMKKYFAAGGSFETVLPHEVTDDDIEDYIRLHLLRWGDGSAAICGNSADYHRKISKAMAEEGLFLLFFARYHGKRIAVHSCFDIGTRREGYITGVDPEFDELRAGRLLYIETIYDAIDKGFNRYELGVVGFDYKMSFVDKTAVAHDFFFYPAGGDAQLEQIFTEFECMELAGFF